MQPGALDIAFHEKVGNCCSEAYQVHLNQIFLPQPINLQQSRAIISHGKKKSNSDCRCSLSEALHIL